MCRTWINPFISKDFKYFYYENGILKENTKYSEERYYHPPEITDTDKVQALERIVTAIFGRQETKIEYRHFKEEYQIPQVVIECDVDDAIKLLSNLSMADIDYDFYAGIRKTDSTPSWEEIKGVEGYCHITLYLNRKYWEEVEVLKKELETIKQKFKHTQ